MKVSKLFVKIIQNDVVVLEREVKSPEMVFGLVAFVDGVTQVVFEERQVDVECSGR